VSGRAILPRLRSFEWADADGPPDGAPGRRGPAGSLAGQRASLARTGQRRSLAHLALALQKTFYSEMHVAYGGILEAPARSADT
jgi:hypothetical protein